MVSLQDGGAMAGFKAQGIRTNTKLSQGFRLF
jgi:hypothetical protein